MSEDALRKYMKAGSIASKVRDKARHLVSEGRFIIDICTTVEKTIKKLGGKPAFPCNICVNDIAAHYSSPPEDKKKIPKDAVVKIDVGVHVDGYIADTATTVSLNSEYDAMVFAAEKALNNAIKVIQPNVKTTKVGEVIKKTVENYGFKPIWNLSGHQINRYVLHTGKSIPNVPRFSISKIKKGEVYAVEPFLTLSSGSGEVRGRNESYIFRCHKSKKTQNPTAMKLLRKIYNEFCSLPFSQRWLTGYLPPVDLNQVFTELVSKKILSAYPVLVEKNHKIVAQAEHTVIVTEKGNLVTTL